MVNDTVYAGPILTNTSSCCFAGIKDGIGILQDPSAQVGRKRKGMEQKNVHLGSRRDHNLLLAGCNLVATFL